MDQLVFWGGSAGEGLILAPNATVIDAAHKNGVPVLGNVYLPPTAFGGQIQWVHDFVQHDANGVFPVAATMNTDNGMLNEIGTSPIRNGEFVADHHGQVRFAYSDGTDQKRRVYYRADNGAPWELVFDESKGDQPLTPYGFARDDKTAYFGCPGAHGVGVQRNSMAFFQGCLIPWRHASDYASAGVHGHRVRADRDSRAERAVRGQPGDRARPHSRGRHRGG